VDQTNDPFEGFHDFVAARSPALIRTAYLLTGDPLAAEELLQAALVDLARRWKRVAREGQPEAYVRRALHTRHISAWRHRQVLVEIPQPDVPASQANDFSTNVDERLAIVQALRRLSPRQRAVIVLRYFEDRSEVETAYILGCSRGTVKSQTHDALNRLRSLLPALGDRDEVAT
jgi:RNA polymerase sigma-70 factor (sigma-E family)